MSGLAQAMQKGWKGASSDAPPAYAVHGALVGTQVLFGIGAVVCTLGLGGTHPLIFALLREGLSGPLLLWASYVLTPTRWADVRREWREFAACGAFIWSNQAFYVVGLKLSNPVAGSIWQPSQPIFTAALAAYLGWERPSPRRICGVGTAFLGCFSMVWVGAPPGPPTRVAGEVLGNAFFFGNCLCASCYVIRCKPLLRRHPALSVTAWAYCFAALMMLATVLLMSVSPPAQAFLCPDCAGAWHVPAAAWPALAYSVIFQSCAAYGLMTWANRHASSSLVSSYSVLQPVTAAAVSFFAVAAGLAGDCGGDDDACLRMPGPGDLGAVAVFAGLYLVVTSEPPPARRTASDEALERKDSPLLEAAADV